MTSVAPFEGSYRDGQSAADLIVALVEGKPYDTVLTFDEIAEHLGIDASDLSRLRSAVQRAKHRLNRDHLRALEAVPRKGYRIIKPGEVARVATHHRKKSDRQIKRAIAVIKSGDERDMTDAERERSRRVGMALSLLHERQVETEKRVSRLEELMLGKSAPKTIPGSVMQPLAIDAAGGELQDEGGEAADG